MATLKSMLKSPRWADAKGIINKIAWLNDCKVKIVEEEKGMFTKVTFFEAEGKGEDIIYFNKQLEEFISEKKK